MDQMNEIPMGLSMSLGMHKDAMANFGRMSAEEKEKVVNRSRDVKSKDEMQQLVRDIGEGKFLG